MAYCCSFIGDEGSTLVVGTERGELLGWEVSKFWSQEYWSSVESDSDARIPHKRVRVFRGGPVYRMALWKEGKQLVLAGKDGLVTVDTTSHQFTVNFPLIRVPTSAQHVFNALALCGDSSYVGCEDGSVLHTVLSVGSTPAEEAPIYTGTSAVLDLACSDAALFVASADGSVVGVDRHSGAPMWRVHLATGSIERGIQNLDVEPAFATNHGPQASLVRLDPSGRWLLMGGGLHKGFLSVWHTELMDPVCSLALHGCPSSVAWVRGELLVCGNENHLHQFQIGGRWIASSPLQMKEAWDVAVYTSSDQLIGACIAVVGGGGKQQVALLTSVGRKPFYLGLGSE